VSTDLAGWQDAVRAGIAGAGPRGGAFAQHVSVRHTTASTNDDVARAALEGAPEGYAVVAAEQTAGRGRRGASWHSPATRGLYLSTLLRPDRWAAVRADAASPVSSLVTLMAGVAVVSAIRAVCDAPVELKWPNDVMVRTARAVRPGAHTPPGGPPWRKLAGILAEGASEGGLLRTVVLGIGLNLSRSEAPTDVAGRMIALDDLISPAPGRSLAVLPALVNALLVGIREGTEALARGGADQVREQWQRCAPSVAGAPVRWQQHGELRAGTAVGIDHRGALRVRVGDGSEVLVHGGDVEWQLETEDP
jgi:BirA family transcriptional regulator, biotin operon repressor / biotin---[acetyl-CoA-carboxylase] ligase